METLRITSSALTQLTARARRRRLRLVAVHLARFAYGAVLGYGAWVLYHLIIGWLG